jgi:integrase
MRINPQNERIKRRYLTYLREAKHLADRTLDGVTRALEQFETHTKRRDFRRFHIQQAMNFKASFAAEVSARTGSRRSESSRHMTLRALKNFFRWLADQPGYKSRISYGDTEYFSLSAKDARIAKARREPSVPTIEQIRHVIRSMSAVTEIERRNQALIAFTLLTGARVGAIASFRLKHVDLIEGKVVQDAREVNTKFSKTFTTYFFPVGEDIVAIVTEWVRYLQHEKLLGYDGPLFPATHVGVGRDQQFEAQGLSRAGWTDGQPIRNIFRDAFRRAGLPYFNPHSFRRTLAILGEQLCDKAEEFKSWSQNLGHEDVLTTFVSYGEVSSRRQAELIRAMACRCDRPIASEGKKAHARETDHVDGEAPTSL